MTAAGITDLAGIWQKLRRRKVVQWGVAYCAASWALLQALEYGTTTFHWPQPILQLATVTLLIGLPIVLVLAWYHGDRGEQQFKRSELAIISVLLLLGGVLLWRYEPATDAASEVDASRLAAPASTSTDTRPSIAVLPFENRSRLEDDAFFVDGIHDDILTQLSKASALKVISRTSVEQIRGKKLSTKEIAEKLGVTRVLEGGVQRAGDRVRIHVQLIDANNDTHLWAESYDRELTVANIFAIQSEVASAIAGALQATLTPGERARMNAIPTQSLEAWEAYQLGRQRLAKRTSTSLAEAERLFQQAIDHDPKFLLAYVALAGAVRLQVWYSGKPREASLARAEALVKRALALDPDHPEAIAASAGLADDLDDHSRSESEYQRAVALNPNDAIAHFGYAGLLGELGRNHEALREIEIALELDPISTIMLFVSAQVLIQLGRVDEALARNRKAIEIDPEFSRAYEGISDIYREEYGRLDIAIPWREKAASLGHGIPYQSAGLALSYFQLGDDSQADQWLERALEYDQWGWTQEIAAQFGLLRGDRDTFEMHARKAAAIDPFRIRWLVVADVRRGDYAAARARYAKGVPELLATELPAVPDPEWGRYLAVMATELAFALQHTGEETRAQALLDFSESRFEGSRDIHVVAIHALRGEPAKALATLRDVDQSVWTLDTAWRYYRDFDHRLASIRDEPEFKAAFARIEAAMATQRARLAARPKDAPLVIEQVAGLK